MTLEEWTRGRGMRLALGALLLGVAACAWTYTRATATVVLPAPVPADGIVPGALTTPGKLPDVNIGSAVALDLFAENRQAPAQRFRMPGWVAPALPPADPIVRLLGTGYTTGKGWFGAMTIDLGRPLYLYVNDPIGPYVIKSIERGKATLVKSSTGKTFDVLVAN